jgi:hypothetical protein
MGFTQRPPTSGGIDPNASPNLPIGDSSQAHDIPTGTGPSLAKLQDWTAWLRANGVIFADPVGSPGVIDGPIEIDGNLYATGNVDVGGDLTVTDDVSVGDDLFVTGDASIDGELTVATAATINGPFTVGDSEYVTLSPARPWSRRNLRMCATAQPADIDAENGSTIVVSGSFIHCIVVNSTGVAFASLLEIDDLPEGQTISTVTVRTKGDSAAPATITRAATYQVVRWIDDTTFDTMSSVASDSHTTGNWTTAVNQTITVTSHSTIDRSYRYAVQVVNHDVDNSDELNLISVLASGTATSLRV